MRHAQQDTTVACEGCHSSIKGGGLSEKRRLIGRRTDWLFYKLFLEVSLVTDYVRNAGHLHLYAKLIFSTYTFSSSAATSAMYDAHCSAHEWHKNGHWALQCLMSFFALPGIDTRLVLMQFDLRVEVATMYKTEGFVHNSEQEQLVATAVVASQQIVDADLRMPNVSTQPRHVTSQSSRNTRYIVTPSQTGGSCNCPLRLVHYPCKHVMKVVNLSTGKSGPEII